MKLCPENGKEIAQYVTWTIMGLIWFGFAAFYLWEWLTL